ncbi:MULTISPECIES: T7SS effector LXG polymorphic toxin [Peribacillus]|uniref:T7SS effector LXG polymorphic toxin n=1 Tax=Peribacillus TaxID=2675229 RepID=UPI001F4F0AFB|nr:MULTISPECIES: T7SS effector LXG polymorphic toxin [unclassified Peribacillus]MCK1981364.1 T7SS effector LXG polymorphic toxin [Peribacillus sp. Aquil_B1]MCK2006889.1 T7SS effector LXG polymorphic toxin [Peribacillus sp. Aquil_B8]
MSMIYESQTLVSAMQTRVGQYKDLKEQLTELKKGFESIVHLDDELQGQGAEAIKGFYKAQIDVVDSWLRLINRHVAFLSGIQGDTIEANLSETVVTVPFLEEELTTANRNSKEMVTAQKGDLKKILAGIDDIIQLEPFSDDAFYENIEKAEKKRTETIDKVNEIDHKWTAEYAKSEADQAAVTALMEQLKISSTRGGVVSPLYFNAAAYKNSEAYKNLEVRKKETAQYLKVKKEEAENRQIKDLKAQLDHVTDPDEFLKIAKQIGYENLAPTQQQYVMQLEASKQTADIAKGIGVGLYDVGKDFVTGVWDFVTDPGETVEDVANSIMHPIQTYKYISKSISDSYERDMVNGDAYSRSHWVTYALGTVVTSVVGTKGAGAVTKTGVATTKAAAVKGVTKAKEFSIPNLLPYNPKNQLLLAGGVPYNVVNGVGLKDQLITMAKVESQVNGDGGKKFTIDTMRHVYHGEINRRGKAVGYHHESMMGGKIVPGTETMPDRNGVYRATVEVNGVRKNVDSSFFPKDWDRVQVLKSIEEAFVNKRQIGRNKYSSLTSSGITIEMYLKPDGSIATAYPIYEGV